MYYIIIILGVLLDQVSKYFVVENLKNQGSLELIKDWLYFTYVENSGAAWGLLSGKRIFFIVFTLMVFGGLIYILTSKKYQLNKIYKLSLALILSGGLGNFIDRLRMGYVVDFIFSPLKGIYNFPVFNVADIFITVGSGLLIIYMLFFEGKKDEDRQ